MKILALSDLEVPAVYGAQVQKKFQNIDLIISCGDLPHHYLDFAVSMLDLPLYYVHGNHVQEIHQGDGFILDHPHGGINLHRKVFYDKQRDLILAGIEGSLRYNCAKHQFTQLQYWWIVISMLPKLIINRLRYGRFLDILVTHAAPAGIHDDSDPAHQGVKAFLWLIKIFKPKLHLHGHVHIYNPLKPRETVFGSTRVINAYAFREISIT